MEGSSLEDDLLGKKPFLRRVVKACKLSGIFSFSMIAVQVQGLITIWFIGNYIGSYGVEAFGLCVVWMQLAGEAVYMGLASALDTLCSHANGAGDHKLQWVYLQRALILALVLNLPSMVLYGMGGSLLASFGLENHYVAEYLTGCILGLPARSINELVSHFLYSQYILSPSVLSSLVLLPTQVLLCSILVPSFGMRGAAFSAVISDWVRLGSLLLAIRFNEAIKEDFKWSSLKSKTKTWIELIKLSVSSTGQIFLEWSSFEISILFAAMIKDGGVSLGAWAIMNKIMIVEEFLSLGVGEAIATLMGNSLAKLKVYLARSYFKICFGIGIALNGSILFLLYINKWSIGSFFLGKNDPLEKEITLKIGENMEIFALIFIFDFVYLVITGAMRGFGRQTQSFFLALLTDCLIGIPLQFFLCFVMELELGGILLAMVSVFLFNFVGIFWVLRNLNWQSEALLANHKD
mgnify:FL=1